MAEKPEDLFFEIGLQSYGNALIMSKHPKDKSYSAGQNDKTAG
jgi:hypothetical protein